MAYGYRENENHRVPKFVPTPNNKSLGYFDTPKGKVELDETIKILRLANKTTTHRPVVLASLGPHVENACYPHVDPSDQATAMAGSMYRFGRKITIQKDLTEFKAFVNDWLKKNMSPLNNVDTSFETWIAQTPYTLARKDQLREKHSKLPPGYKIDRKFLKISAFIKDEIAVDYKHARAINSRSDEYKCKVGPIFNLISKELFKQDWFIKKIPINERPKYIIDRLMRIGSVFRTTDYTSFEAHFTGHLKQNCEFQLYEYMTNHLSEGKDWMELVRKGGLTEDNQIHFKTFSMSINSKRMSGEMDTSLGNGFSNLMLMLYICHKNGNKDISGVVEGDDGLFVMTGAPPAQKMFDNFGLVIKILDFEELNHASFCGLVFDLDDKTNVTDPIAALVEFGWTTARYARSNDRIHKHLIRAKALSLAYQYPSCPILSKMAYKMCQLTAGYDSAAFLKKQGTHAFCQYELEVLNEAEAYFKKNGLLNEPRIGTRQLVSKLYGIEIADQITIEKYIEELTEIVPLSHPLINIYVSEHCHTYYDKYALKLPYKHDNDNRLSVWPGIRPAAKFVRRI